jgi:TPR repeat protein
LHTAADRADSGKTHFWAKLAIITIVVLTGVLGLWLNAHYCLLCTDSQKLNRGLGLVVAAENENAARRGWSMINRAADNGHMPAVIARAELSLPQLPDRYLRSYPEAGNDVRRYLPDAQKQAALDWRLLAQRNDLDEKILYNVGVLLRQGLLQEEDIGSNAADFFQRLADSNNPFGLLALGHQLHLEGDYRKAANKFAAAFAAGRHPEAAIFMGDYHLYGRGMKSDPYRARYWYRRALHAAQRSPYQNLAGNLGLTAEKRLQLVERRIQTLPDTPPRTIEYRVTGTPRESRVLVGSENNPVGRVFHENGKQIKARYEGGEESLEQNVDSIAQGIDWIMQTHVAQIYGDKTPVKLRLVQD